MQNFWSIAWKLHRVHDFTKDKHSTVTTQPTTHWQIIYIKYCLNFQTDHRHKRGAILASILRSVASSVIGLAYEGISSFLHHKRCKALHKAVTVMDKKINIQCNRIHHLEDTMIMYGVYNYNSDTLTDLIDTVHRMQNFTTWNKKTFAGKLHDWMELYSHNEGVHNYAINSVLFFDYGERKICKNVWKIYWGTKIIFYGDKSFIKRVPTHFPITTIKIGENSKRSENSNCKIKQRLWSSPDKTLLILQHEISYIRNRQPKEFDCTFPCVCATLHPEKIDYVSNFRQFLSQFLDKNEQAHSYTKLKIEKPYIALNEETYITLHAKELKMCKKIGYKYYCKELFVVKSKTRYSCASTIYFTLESDIIKANCEFLYYYNKTNIKPTVLDGGFQIILANLPSYRKIMCSHNNNIPISIPAHPYILMNRSILCNCECWSRKQFPFGITSSLQRLRNKNRFRNALYNKFGFRELLLWTL